MRTPTALSDEIIARPEAAEIILAKLRAMVAAGTQETDAILGTIAVAAHALTGASGAAIAMPRDGAVVCVGRSGDIAPNLGARLDVHSGISGECLRTGMNLRCDDAARDFKVDPEVCRELGLQSIAVVPLRGQVGRVGVLEVFSTQSYAFTEEHVNLLGRLAGLAEAAWARGTAAEPLPAEPAFAESALAEPPEEAIAEEPVAEASHTPDLVSEAPAVSAKDPITSPPIDEELRLSRASIALERVGDAIASGLRREQENERKWHLGVVAGLSVLRTAAGVGDWVEDLAQGQRSTGSRPRGCQSTSECCGDSAAGSRTWEGDEIRRESSVGFIHQQRNACLKIQPGGQNTRQGDSAPAAVTSSFGSGQCRRGLGTCLPGAADGLSAQCG